MPNLIATPPVPELARIPGGSAAEAAEYLIDLFNSGSGPFNYRTASRAILASYKGFQHLPQLLASCGREKLEIAQKANRDVIELAAPVAFGRKTQVFELSPRRFPFSPDRQSSYRIPFLFVENAIVKVYFLQPGKHGRLSESEIGMIATIVKKFLLDTEFFGQKCDIEFVDVGVSGDDELRTRTTSALSDVALWSDRQLTDRLNLISDALKIVEASERLARRPRFVRRPDPSMPLFD